MAETQYKDQVYADSNSGTSTTNANRTVPDTSVQMTSKAANATDADNQNAVSKYTANYSNLINDQYAAQQQQIANNVDYQTQKAQDEQVRAYNDSKSDYQKQYRQYTNQMYQGVDNSALTSRASGQYGGTATQNANAVQSQYQTARQELALQQQKLATDTMREVENLRAQGEFDKADQLMQSRMNQFNALYQEGVRVDENAYNAYVQQNTWDREDNELDRQEAVTQQETMQQTAMLFLNKGLTPPAEYAEALFPGIGESERNSMIEQYIKAVKAGKL